MDIYGKIEKLLTNNGIKPAQLAKDTGISTGLLTQWKQRKQNPSIEKLAIVAEYFNVSVDYLLGNTTLITCPICGLFYDLNIDAEEHKYYHEKVQKACQKFGFWLSPQKQAFEKAKAYDIIYSEQSDDSAKYNAFISLFKSYFSRSIYNNDFNLLHVSFNDYVSMLLNQKYWKNKIPENIYQKLVLKYGASPGLEEGVTTIDIQKMIVSKQKEDSFTPDEQAHIKKYRALDEYGKETVDIILNREHERILSYEAEETPEEYFIKYYDMPASAGTGVPLDDEPYQYLKVPETPTTLRADFAIRVSGDSMEPKYYDGDILLVESAIDIEIGEIGIFVLNGAGYVKKKGRKGLISLNENYNDIDVKEYDNCKCVGKVIGKL